LIHFTNLSCAEPELTIQPVRPNALMQVKPAVCFVGKDGNIGSTDQGRYSQGAVDPDPYELLAVDRERPLGEREERQNNDGVNGA
jgi:hypothetical protein